MWRFQERKRKVESLEEGEVSTVVDLPSSPCLSVLVESLLTICTEQIVLQLHSCRNRARLGHHHKMRVWCARLKTPSVKKRRQEMAQSQPSLLETEPTDPKLRFTCHN